MDEKMAFIETLDSCLTEELCAADPAGIYAFLCAFFDGVRENRSLPCPAELDAENMTVSPMFAVNEDGRELLMINTRFPEEEPLVANIRICALIDLMVRRENCDGFVFNLESDRAYYIPKELILNAFLAACQMIEHDSEKSESPAADEEKKVLIRRPIDESEFEKIREDILGLRDDPDDFRILELEDDADMLFIQMARSGDELHVELAFDMDDFNWDHPLILGNDLPLDQALELLYELCVDGESPDDIELVQTSFRDMGRGLTEKADQG